MSAQQVIQTLTQATQQAQTIGIYFYGMIGSDYRSGFVLLEKGQLVQFFVYDATGLNALELLEIMEIRGVTTVALEPQARRKDAGLPSLAEILRILEEMSLVMR